MATLRDVDPIFGGEQPSVNLEEIDPIFKDKPTKGPRRVEVKDRPVTEEILDVVSRPGAATAGALAGVATRSATKGMLTDPVAKEAEQFLKFERQQKLKALADKLAAEKLAAQGVAAPTAPRGTIPTPGELDRLQHATTAPTPTTSLARERGQQFGTKQTFERGRQASSTVSELAKRGITAAPEEALGRLGAYSPTTTGRVLIPQNLATDVEAMQAANAAKEVERLNALKSAAQAEADAEIAQMLKQSQKGPLRSVAEAAGKSRVVSGVAGAGAGLSFYDALERWNEGDRSGAVIAALGGIGGLAAAVPPIGPVGLGVKAIGTGLGLASIPAQYINDVIKGKTELPEFVKNMGGLSQVPPTAPAP